jgi:hypothetical protein
MYALHDHDKDLQKKGCFLINENQASQLNQKGYGIFFSPNTFLNGKRVEGNLQKLNAWYVDMDKGSKELMKEKILSFPLIPTLWVETHKGFHVYWNCEKHLVENEMVGDYLNILERLVKHFDGDTNAMGSNRILRVPNYYHCKDPDNKFLVTEVFSCNEVYTIEKMNEVLPGVQEVEKEQEKIKFFQQVPTDDFWKSVYDLDCSEVLPMLSGSPECNGENFRIEKVGSKGKIYVDGEMVSSCWIDPDGKIGSHDNGGPTVANWVYWYVRDWSIVATCLKRQIPNLNQQVTLPCVVK